MREWRRTGLRQASAPVKVLASTCKVLPEARVLSLAAAGTRCPGLPRAQRLDQAKLFSPRSTALGRPLDALSSLHGGVGSAHRATLMQLMRLDRSNPCGGMG